LFSDEAQRPWIIRLKTADVLSRLHPNFDLRGGAGVHLETKKKDVVWFALNENRPLFAFAGIWTTFSGTRGTKSKPIPGPHQVYGFLTTAANEIVAPIHPKAMPVILTTDEERPSGCARHGMRRRRCNGRFPMKCWKSWREAWTKKIGQPRDPSWLATQI
jgi:hypothetical protein